MVPQLAGNEPVGWTDVGTNVRPSATCEDRGAPDRIGLEGAGGTEADRGGRTGGAREPRALPLVRRRRAHIRVARRAPRAAASLDFARASNAGLRVSRRAGRSRRRRPTRRPT